MELTFKQYLAQTNPKRNVEVRVEEEDCTFISRDSKGIPTGVALTIAGENFYYSIPSSVSNNMVTVDYSGKRPNGAVSCFYWGGKRG